MKHLKTFEGNVMWGHDGPPLRRKRKIDNRLSELHKACLDIFAELIDDKFCSHIEYDEGDKDIMILFENLDNPEIGVIKKINERDSSIDKLSKYIDSYKKRIDILEDIKVALLRLTDEFPDVIIKDSKNSECYECFYISLPKIKKT